MFNRNDRILIGKVKRSLSIHAFYSYSRRWYWKYNFFKKMYISTNALNPHMTIVGQSGSGKSNLAKLIIKGLASHGAGIAILDPHNEYLGIAETINANVYDAAFNSINIFDRDGMSAKEKTSEITALFKKVFHLGDVQGYTLYRCISYSYYIAEEKGKSPTINDVLFSIKAFKRHASTTEQNTLEGLERRISLLDTGQSSRSPDINSVIKGKSLFLLSSLHTPEAQTVYIEGFLRKVYTNMLNLEKSSKPLFYILIDEAERVSESDVLGRIAAEGRKYGIGIIAISQRAKSIAKSLRNNSAIFISFYQHEPEELNYISNFISAGSENNRLAEVKKGIRLLSKGHAMVLDSREKDPFIAKFQRCDESTINVPHSIITLARNGATKHDIINELSIHGVQLDVIGSRIADLVKNGTLSYHVLDIGSEYDGTWYLCNPRNSAEHDVRVLLISRHLSKNGIRNRIYNSSYGPDIIINGVQRTAIEYETGLKDIETTKKMLEKRKALYPKIIVVVNDSYYDKYKWILGVEVAKFSDFIKYRKSI